MAKAGRKQTGPEKLEPITIRVSPHTLRVASALAKKHNYGKQSPSGGTLLVIRDMIEAVFNDPAFGENAGAALPQNTAKPGE